MEVAYFMVAGKIEEHVYMYMFVNHIFIAHIIYVYILQKCIVCKFSASSAETKVLFLCRFLDLLRRGNIKRYQIVYSY